MRIEKVADAYELLGQVLPEDPSHIELAGLVVHLENNETATQSTATDAEGMFQFTDLVAQSYQLQIVLGADVIEIPKLSVC